MASDFGNGPVPKQFRAGFPSHMGTALGGFVFSIRGSAGVSFITFAPHADNNKLAQSAAKAAIRRKLRGNERLLKRGILVKIRDYLNPTTRHCKPHLPVRSARPRRHRAIQSEYCRPAHGL